MAYDPTNAVTARAMLEDAIAPSVEPTLTVAQVDRAFALASSLDTDGVTVLYTAASLNKSAAWAWNTKAAKAAALVDLASGSGASLKESAVYLHCRDMAAAYGTGKMSVTGTSSGRGIGSIGVITPLSKPYWDALDATS